MDAYFCNRIMLGERVDFIWMNKYNKWIRDVCIQVCMGVCDKIWQIFVVLYRKKTWEKQYGSFAGIYFFLLGILFEIFFFVSRMNFIFRFCATFDTRRDTGIIIDYMGLAFHLITVRPLMYYVLHLLWAKGVGDRNKFVNALSRRYFITNPRSKTIGLFCTKYNIDRTTAFVLTLAPDWSYLEKPPYARRLHLYSTFYYW